MSDCRFGVSPVNYPDPDPEYMYRAIKAENRIINIEHRTLQDIAIFL